MAETDGVDIPTYVDLMRPTLGALDELGGSGTNDQSTTCGTVSAASLSLLLRGETVDDVSW